MLYQLTNVITIDDNIEFDFVTNVIIKSSWKDLTDTAEIQMPKKLKWEDNSVVKLDEIIKVGDRVKIELGYNWELHTEFEGYVSRPVQPGIPFTIYCEDNMWQMKKGSLSHSWKMARLSDVLAYIVPPQYKVDAVEAELGPFLMHRATPAQVLRELKDKFGLYSWFRGDTLYVGKVRQSAGAEVEYHFQDNVISTDELAFKRKKEVSLKVTAISMQRNNKQLKVSVPDGIEDKADVEEHTLHFAYIDNKEELRRHAQRNLERLWYDGYRGNFSCFGQPFVQHNDVANIVDEYYPEKAGRYYVDKVETEFGTSGFHRKVYLGPKA
jgi:hypothetical protein